MKASSAVLYELFFDLLAFPVTENQVYQTDQYQGQAEPFEKLANNHPQKEGALHFGFEQLLGISLETFEFLVAEVFNPFKRGFAPK